MAKYRIHVTVYNVNGDLASGALVDIGPTPPNFAPAASGYMEGKGSLVWYSPGSASRGYTNALGEYISPPLNPGKYTITGTASAKRGVSPGIGVQKVQLIDHDVTVPLRLKPISSGLVTQPITQPLGPPYSNNTYLTSAITQHMIVLGGIVLLIVLFSRR